MRRARDFILERGGLTNARVFTKLHLALFGAYPWEGLPTLPPWFMFKLVSAEHLYDGELGAVFDRAVAGRD